MSNKRMELKFNVVEDDEFREVIKELVKTQVVAISREEFSRIVKDALTEKTKKQCRKIDFKEEVRQVIRECIFKSIPDKYRDFNEQVKYEIREVVNETMYEKFKKMEW